MRAGISPFRVASRSTLTRWGSDTDGPVDNTGVLPAPWFDAVVGPDTSLMIGSGELKRGWVIDAVEPGTQRRIATYEAEYSRSGPAAALVLDPDDELGLSLLAMFEVEPLDIEIGLRLVIYTAIVAPQVAIRAAVAQLDVPGIDPIPAGGGWFAVVAAGGITVVGVDGVHTIAK